MEIFGLVVVVLVLVDMLDGFIANGTAKRIDEKERQCKYRSHS